jgi:hypothetical protein
VAAGSNGPAWIVSLAPNTYRPRDGDDRREHFRAAESTLFFGLTSRPAVSQSGDAPRYRVTVTPSVSAFAVSIRGNAELVAALTRDAAWSQLTPR